MTIPAPAMETTNPGAGWVKILTLLAILLVIAAMVVPNLIGSQSGPNVSAPHIAIVRFENALKLYAVAHGEFPEGSSEEVIARLMNPGQGPDGKSIPAFLEKPPRDPWGQALNYEWPNSKFPEAKKPAIWSNGLNKQNEDGAGDDITNWSDD